MPSLVCHVVHLLISIACFVCQDFRATLSLHIVLNVSVHQCANAASVVQAWHHVSGFSPKFGQSVVAFSHTLWSSPPRHRFRSVSKKLTLSLTAPSALSASAVSVCPYRSASPRGVFCAQRFIGSRKEPYSTNCWVVLVLPSDAARCRGVLSDWSPAFTARARGWGQKMMSDWSPASTAQRKVATQEKFSATHQTQSAKVYHNMDMRHQTRERM
jgi:hypothetical protein